MIKYGSHVAFLFEGTIRFGYIAAIVQRTDANGESTEHVICSNSVNTDGRVCAETDVTIKDEKDIADMEAWNKDEAILSLARRSPLWVKSKEQSEAIPNPAEPAPAPVEEAPPTNPSPLASPKGSEEI